jgi:hypothetical protein
MTDSEQLRIIVEFLRQFDQDAFARTLEPLPPELEARLVRLANGEADPAEVRSLLTDISRNRAAITRLAELLRAGADPEPEPERD